MSLNTTTLIRNDAHSSSPYDFSASARESLDIEQLQFEKSK